MPEFEARLRCPQCHGVPYHLYRRPVAPDGLIYESVLMPVNGAPSPPTSGVPMCPHCGVGLERA